MNKTFFTFRADEVNIDPRLKFIIENEINSFYVAHNGEGQKSYFTDFFFFLPYKKMFVTF